MARKYNFKKNKGTFLIVGLILFAAIFMSTHNLSFTEIGYPHVAPVSTTVVLSNNHWKVWEVVMPEQVKSIPHENFVFKVRDTGVGDTGECRDFGQSTETCYMRTKNLDSTMTGDFWKYPNDYTLTTKYGRCWASEPDYNIEVYFLGNYQGVNMSSGSTLTYITGGCLGSIGSHTTGTLIDATPPLGIDSNTFYIAIKSVGGWDDGCCGDETGAPALSWIDFPLDEIYYVPMDIEIPVEPILIASSESPYCPVPSGYVLATETFSGPENLTIDNVRFPVNYFCESLPILQTDVDTGLTAQLIQPYSDMLDGSEVQVPVGSTWTIFYGTEASANMNLVCPDGSVYNASSNICEVYPAVVHICTEGVLDPDTGLCTIQADTIIDCPQGIYDENLDKCVYTPEEETAVCEQGTYNAISGKCEISPGTVALCDQGYYDTSLELCVYHPPIQGDCPSGTLYNVDRDACEWDPDTLAMCDSVGTYNADLKMCEAQASVHTDCEYTCDVYDSTENPDEFTITKLTECVADTFWDDEDGVGQERHETQVSMACETTPVCSVGVYDESSQMCSFPPNTETPYCEDGIWDETTKRCTTNPSMLLSDGNILEVLGSKYSLSNLVALPGTYKFLIGVVLGALYLLFKKK